MRHRLTVRSFVTITAGVATLALGGDIWLSRHGPLAGPRPAVFWLLAACCLTTELRPLRWLRYSGGGEVTGSWTFMVAMLMVASPLAAVTVSAALFVAGDLWARKSVMKIAFNLAQIVVALSLGAAILHAFGQGDALLRGGTPDAVWFPLAVAACASAFAVNTLLTSVVIALSQRISVRSVLREHGAANVPTDGMLLALSPIFAVVAERSLALVIPLLATTWVVYHSARLALQRQHEATHDHLTQLPNQRLLADHLADALEATGGGERVGLLLLDLDEFKQINDGLGRSVGDQVLTLVAERLNGARRPADLLARLGGDEFALVLPQLPDLAVAEDIGRRLQRLFDTPFDTEGFPVVVRASIGIAVYPDHADDAATLLRRADEAMYTAKLGQRSPSVYRLDRDDAKIGRLGLLADLVRALTAGELFLEYQPQLALADGRVVGVEALLRWRHPVVGLVQPAAFMPLAEQTELIGPVTEWVLRAALAQCATWRDSGRDLVMAVNVSVRNLQEIRFPRVVEAALRDTGVAPSSLVVEITENTVALDRSTVRTVLRELRDLGVAVSIDDFGTGYSSISQLRELPVDQLKLDRRFVANMAHDGRDALIVRTILQLGAALGIQTVAEGVEEELVAGMLADLGCEQAQGYLFARPMPADDLLRWLTARDPWQVGSGRSAPLGAVPPPS